MKKQHAILTLVLTVFLLVSFSTDPPNGKTGAPGDSICSECHTPQSQTLNGTVSVEGFPSVISPNDTFRLTVVNRNSEGDAVRGGFQMTILGPLNTIAGKMINLSTTTRVQKSGNREYFEHHPAVAYPDSNVIRWSVDWVASDLTPGGLVTCYVAGNICNGNFQSSGDRTVTAQASGTVLVSSSREIKTAKLFVYPNPGSTEIFVQGKDQDNPDGHVYFFNSEGQSLGGAIMNQGKIDVPPMPSGIYWISIQTATAAYLEKWIKI